MKSITTKLLLTSLIIVFFASFIPSLVMSLVEGELIHRTELRSVSSTTLVITGLSTAAITVTALGTVINQFLIKRVKKVTTATKEVMNGNFETHIEEKGKDEVSELIHNFNLMSSELQNNEYLNKEFVRNFSHELKTPLSAIKGYAELMENMELTDSEKSEYLQIIISEATRLSTLSRNMLLISQVDNQIIIPKNNTYNISEQIRNIILTMQLSWEEKNIEWDINLNDTSITSNKELLYQVFSNLLSNAIKFTEKDKKISLSLYGNEKEVIFTITNPGTLTTEECSKVFELFYIKDKSRSSKSNGVGLSLTQKILDKLNGKVTVSSSNNLITFKVVLSKA